MANRFRSSRLVARLRDTHGFMLGEQLVSIIFIGLLCIVVAAGLSASMSVYVTIREQTLADNLLVRAVETVSDEFAFAESVEGDDDVLYDDGITFVSSSQQQSVTLLGHQTQGIYLMLQGNAVLLVPAQDGLVPSVTDVAYYRKGDSTQGIPARTWVFTVNVSRASGGDPVASTTMKVQRIGS